ncbi:MAG TPA: L,D-transpeptidase [Trebonia sp.]
MFRGIAKTALASRGSRAAVTVGVIGAAAVGVSAGWMLTSGGTQASPQGNQPPAVAPARQADRPEPDGAASVVGSPATATMPATAAPASTAPASTELATVRRGALRYTQPGLLAGGTVAADWYGRPSVLPVIATERGWIEVRLAQRPNGATAWLPASDVTLASTPYRIVVNIATTRLALYDRGRLVFSAPAGVGTPDDPTPTGEYFVAFDEQPPQPNPGYGPFIMVTSAHSPSISDWEGSGDAVIGIHGPLGEDSEIGTAGGRISHGCIRLHDQALERLTEVPPGTPIDIVG